MFKKSIDQEVLAQGRAHVDTRSPTVTRKDKAAVVMKPWQKFPGETQEQAMLRKVSEQLGHGDMHEEEMFESTPTENPNVREKGGAKLGKDALYLLLCTFVLCTLSKLLKWRERR